METKASCSKSLPWINHEYCLVARHKLHMEQLNIVDINNHNDNVEKIKWFKY